MTDTIASRVTRVIGGSVHACFDAVENVQTRSDHGPSDPPSDPRVGGGGPSTRSGLELGRVEVRPHLPLRRRASTSSNTQKETLAEQTALRRQGTKLARAGIAKQIDIDDQIPVAAAITPGGVWGVAGTGRL